MPLVYDPHRDATIAPGIAASPEVAQAENWLGLSAVQDEELIALHVPTGCPRAPRGLVLRL